MRHSVMNAPATHAALDFVTGPIEVEGCHAEGEVGDVIGDVIAVPPGDDVWELSKRSGSE